MGAETVGLGAWLFYARAHPPEVPDYAQAALHLLRHDADPPGPSEPGASPQGGGEPMDLDPVSGAGPPVPGDAGRPVRALDLRPRRPPAPAIHEPGSRPSGQGQPGRPGQLAITGQETDQARGPALAHGAARAGEQDLPRDGASQRPAGAQRIIAALAGESAAGRYARNAAAQAEIDNARREADDAFRAWEPDTPGEREWLLSLRDMRLVWRRLGHLEPANGYKFQIGGRPRDLYSWLFKVRHSRRKTPIPGWVVAVLDQMADLREREITDSLTAERQLREALWGVLETGSAAGAEAAGLAAEAAAARARVDEALADRDGENALDRRRRRHGLRALVEHWRANGDIEAPLLDGSRTRGQEFLRQVRKPGTPTPGWVRKPVDVLDAPSPTGIRIATDGMLARAGLAGQPDAGLASAGRSPLSSVPSSRVSSPERVAGLLPGQRPPASVLQKWPAGIRDIIDNLDAERAAGRNLHDPASRQRIEQARNATGAALAALAALAADEHDEHDDHQWTELLQEALGHWRQLGHLEIRTDRRLDRRLQKARARGPVWVQAALKLLDDAHGREIEDSVAAEATARQALQELQRREPAAPAEEITQARKQMERAESRVDDALTDNPGHLVVRRGNLRGLQALVRWWRREGARPPDRGLLYNWIRQHLHDRPADPRWLRRTIGLTGVSVARRMTDDRVDGIVAAVTGELHARQALRRLEDEDAPAATLEEAQARVGAASLLADQLLTARPDDGMNIDRLKSLRAAVMWWREHDLSLKPLQTDTVLLDGEQFPLGRWLDYVRAARQRMGREIGPLVRKVLDVLDMRWQTGAAIGEGRAREIAASLNEEREARDDLIVAGPRAGQALDRVEQAQTRVDAALAAENGDPPMLSGQLDLLRAALKWWREQYWGDNGPWINIPGPGDPPRRLPRRKTTVLLDGKEYRLGRRLVALRSREGGRTAPEWMQGPLNVMGMPWQAAAPRRGAQRRARSSPAVGTAIELFTGAGGLERAVRDRFVPVLAVEKDPDAVATLLLNGGVAYD
ncbi:MAG TPA: proline-rich domain-containing protein, partial [Streptosporangiaceae bacterium]|nr:proline-rich domain-containing protein [Streptosporangiaceae bacterium]